MIPANWVGVSRVVSESSSVLVENLVSGRLASKGMNQEIEAMMSESVAALDYLKYQEVSNVDMVNRLSICMANM